MKSFISAFLIAFLAVHGGAQTLEATAGERRVNSQLVTWTTGANTGKTRLLFLGNAVYLDTSSTGQAGAFKRIDNTSDSCSVPFLLTADSAGATRAADNFTVWGLFRGVDGDSTTHTYRFQQRERQYVLARSGGYVATWTPWTRRSANYGFDAEATTDSITFPNIGGTAKTSQYSHFEAVGTQARLCPDDIAGTANGAADSVFADSLRVYALAQPRTGKPVSATISGTITTDGELPAAAALADGAANPTTPTVGAAGLVFNGTTWDRQRGNTTAAYTQGPAADDAAATGNPVVVGGVARATDATAASADNDAVYSLYTRTRKQVVMPYSVQGERWSYPAASGGITNTTAVTVKAAAGANIRNCVTSIQVINGHATVSTETLLVDGAAGTVLHRGFAQAAGGGYAIEFPVPICGTANTLLEVDNVTTGSAVYYNVQGFEAEE